MLPLRVGIGYDIHALKKGRRLILGGVRIPHSKGLVGHSDGDALFHAAVDAALGAAGAGDIGGHFPDDDPRWRGASGRSYTHTVYSLIECPPLPAAAIILARRDPHGEARALRVLVAHSDAPTLNLAQVRQQGAAAGANEVHVHLDTDTDRRLVACDLRAALFGTLAACAEA